MPPKQQPPDYTQVLEELAKQKTETTQALMGILKAQGEAAAADRQEFKIALKELTQSNTNHTLAINDLKNTIDKRDISCDAHAAEIKALKKEVTGDGPGDTCSAKSRLQRLENNHDNLDSAFKGFRDAHNLDAERFRTEVGERISKVEKQINCATKAGATWLVKILWVVIVALGTALGWLAKEYYTGILAHHTSTPAPLTK